MSEISRVTRSKAEAKTSYDWLSKWYDVLAGASEKRFRDRGLDLLGAQLGETILEIGFGTGQALLALARSVGETGKVYGIDISKGMREVAMTRVEKSGFAGRVELSCGDAVRIPFDAGIFDAIFMSFTLELFDIPEIPIVLQECRRVLRRGGRLCTITMAKAETKNLASVLYDWAHQRFPTFVDCRPILARSSLKAVGFNIHCASRRTMWGLPVDVLLASM